MKKEGIIFLSLFLAILFLPLINANPVIQFNDPTPANDSEGSEFTVNMTGTSSGDSYAFLDYDDLVLWIKSDNATHVDYSKNNVTITTTSDVQNIAGIFGNATYFNGTQLMNINNGNFPGLLSSKNNSYSVSMWFKSALNANMDLVDSYNSAEQVTGRVMIRLLSGGNLRCSFMSDGVYYTADTSGLSLFNNNWHHVACVYDRENNEVRTYVDGKLASSYTGDSRFKDINLGTTNFIIGGATVSSLTLNGSIDELAVFTRALNIKDIKALYNFTNNGYINNLTTIKEDSGMGTYRGVIVQSNGLYNVTETKAYNQSKRIVDYSRPLNFSANNISVYTNFDSSCNYSINGGVFSPTIDQTKKTHFIPVTDAGNNITFNCYDSSGQLFNKTIETVRKMYIDINNYLCDNEFSKTEISREYFSLCDLSLINGTLQDYRTNSVQIFYPEDIWIIKNGTYNGRIKFLDGGLPGKPVTIMGEFSSLGSMPLINAINYSFDAVEIDFDDYIIVKNLKFNGSRDLFNAAGAAIGIEAHNIIGYHMGVSSQGSSDGDGFTFHDDSSGIGTEIKLYDSYKGASVSIDNTITNISNLYGNGNRLYGVYLKGDGFHHSWNVTIEQTPSCYWSDATSYAYNLECNNISGVALQLTEASNYIDVFNIYTNTSEDSVLISGTENNYTELKNGLFNNNISFVNASNVFLVNVTYNDTQEELTNSNYTRQWYFTPTIQNSSGSVLSGVNVTIGSQGYTSDSNGQISTNLTDYVSNNGVRNYSSSYLIELSLSGYSSYSETVNLTQEHNYAPTYTLSIPTSQETTSTSSSGSGSPVYRVGESNLNKGYSKLLGNGWKIKFNFENETHELDIQKILSNSATIIISSDPIVLTLFVNQTEKVDLNRDGFYDLLVSLKSITGKSPYQKGDFYIQLINEEILKKSENMAKNESTGSNNFQEESNSKGDLLNDNSSKSLYRILGVVLALVVVLFLIIKYSPRIKRK